jgi:hypothetical protein
MAVPGGTEIDVSERPPADNDVVSVVGRAGWPLLTVKMYRPRMVLLRLL